MRQYLLRSFQKMALLNVVLLCISIISFAQSGSIRGVVTDTALNEPAFVDVALSGPQKLFSPTNENGAFMFTGLAAGNYTINISGLGFQDHKIEVKVEEGKESVLQIAIGAETKQMEGAVVVATRRSNTSAAVLNEVKAGNEVISGISQEQIKSSQDRTAAQVMSRVPGVTVVDGRFIMVRGIPERYNQVLMNNAIAPSTEVDKRTFSFDLIPSSVLDRMMIYKSGAPENTGDFAGGLIKVYTSNAAEDDFTEVSLSAGYRMGTTGNEYIQTKGSSTDLLGFDDGFRKLPGQFPSANLRELPNRSQKRIDAAHLLNNNFAPETSTAMPDFGVGFTISRNMKVGSKKLSTISAINYGQSYTIYDKSFNRYLEMDPVSKQVENRFAYIDNSHEKDNRIGAISNWSLFLNERNRIELKNLFNQIGENTSVMRTGEDFIQFRDHERRNYMFQYRARTVYSGQLEGKHDHTAFNKPAHLNWVLGLNYLGEDQPDLRRFRTIETGVGTDEFRMVLPPSSNLYDAGRFYSNLNEIGFSQGLNYKINLGKGTDEEDLNGNEAPQLKFGYMLDYRSRNFDTRYFSYFYPGNSSLAELQRLERLPLDQIFSKENVKLNDGFSMEEGTRASDSYTASNFLSAGYVGIVYPLGKLHLSGGFRGEYNVLRLNARTDAGSPIEVNSPIFSPLAFFNSDYDLSSKTKIRLAYYRSVNRPEFRELAPFLFYDYQFDAERYGNPDLKTANIDNLDLRYEIYPRAGEAISIGAFYKHFTNPIETLILIRSESPAFSYQNAASAFSGGLELELRKSLKGLTSSSFVDKFSLNVNASYIISRVNYGENAPAGQEAERALQGQSPYILNTILSYTDAKAGWNVSTSYNVFGPRIFAVSSSLFPSIYEMPRHSLDLTISKRFANNWSAKLGVQDLLNSAFRFYQDTDRNTQIDVNGKDLPIFNYRRGTLISLGLSYRF